MDIIDERNVRIQPLNNDWYGNAVAAVDMLRLDMLHPIISGNKWYKLRLNVLYAQEHNYKTLVTFGGGHSNHLAATAHAAKVAGLRSVGVVRGKYLQLTATLEACAEDGMELIFVTQTDYSNKKEPEWELELAEHFDEIYLIPEGGANDAGRKGAELICRFIDGRYTHIALSVGSGTTLTGIRNKAASEQKVMGFAPMKQGAYLKDHIEPHLHADKNANWDVLDTWHFGGFGKWTDELIDFMNAFYTTNKIPLDIIYTSKMMYGMREMISASHFQPSDKILCIHTGGLQGNTMVNDRLRQHHS